MKFSHASHMSLIYCLLFNSTALSCVAYAPDLLPSTQLHNLLESGNDLQLPIFISHLFCSDWLSMPFIFEVINSLLQQRF